MGVTGELYVGGAGVARGYLNRPELTRERFIDDPFVAGGRLYRTGDLARWRTDGRLEYLGRNDFQVKIRGFRIELGEIEAQLAKVAGVREVVVLARDSAAEVRDSATEHATPNALSPSPETSTATAAATATATATATEKRLVAYYTGDADVAALRAQAAQHLPSYMVPSAYVRLDAWPLTPNGKLDRRALPAPADDAYARAEYEAPQGAKEEALAAIWRELLHVERVSRHDNFFELGGHSLLARLRRAGRVDAVSFARLRLLGMGDVGRVAAWWSAGDRADGGNAHAVGVLCAAVRGRRDGAESDAERVSGADVGAGGAGGGGREYRARKRSRPPAALCHLRWRGAGAADARVVVCPSRRAYAVGEHVWNHRDDGARDVLCAASGRRHAFGCESDRRADSGFAAVRAGRSSRAGADGRDGRAVCGRGGCRTRVLEPAGADAGAVHRRSVRGGWAAV
ncbi:non-ribosomal peptide synthetase [Burkholderia pseudomallei]|nr:non-ribosomal peptide synthetase [Burkholderia pseudomallei]